MVKKYSKIPVVIEALEYKDDTEETHREILDFTNGAVIVSEDGKGEYTLTIKTLEGEYRVSMGDFIIKGVAGEFYPCKPEIFKRTYMEEY